MRNKTAQDVYEDSETGGFYEEIHRDEEIALQIRLMLHDDYLFAKHLRGEKAPRWRVIFNAHYDILRELCDLLLMLKERKTSNHQAAFAGVVVLFPELELDWGLLELIRKMRHGSKYEGKDITHQMWKSVELQFDLYMSAVQKKVEEMLSEK